LFLKVFSALALIGDTFQAGIGIGKCWFLRRGENQSTQRFFGGEWYFLVV